MLNQRKKRKRAFYTRVLGYVYRRGAYAIFIEREKARKAERTKYEPLRERESRRGKEQQKPMPDAVAAVAFSIDIVFQPPPSHHIYN